MTTSRVLVIDVGTSGVRAALVRPDGSTAAELRTEVLPSSPAGGLVEFDPVRTLTAAVEVAQAVRAAAGAGEQVAALGITNQRASTVVWDARSGEPVGPGIGWQDLRTVGRCLELQAEGVRVAPNLSATKAEWLARHTDVAHDDLRLGTVDSWLTWKLTDGACHVTDATNAQITGLLDARTLDWDDDLLAVLGLGRHMLPTVVDSAATVGSASLLDGVPIAALVGDQQASLIGQGCLAPGEAKITFGTGGMLDVCLGDDPGPASARSTFPIITNRLDGSVRWGREAVMLSAGTTVEWLRDGLGIIDDAADAGPMASSVPSSDGVVFVPSLSGLGSPVWDHGARGLLIGITRGTTAAHVVRAVLEGVAQRGADLVDAVETDTGVSVGTLRVDGGMTADDFFVQSVADATGHVIERSAQREATALGAAFLAGVAVGVWPDLESAVASRPPGRRFEPSRTTDRARFAEARDRAQRWIPELSALEL